MQAYDQAWKAIIQPLQIKGRPRQYGPRERIIDNYTIIRQDIILQNKQNKKLVGFMLYSPDFQSEYTVLYVHGNGGTKLQSLPFIELLTQYRINVFAYDLIGSGQSDPGYLTYGVNQMQDIYEMIKQIKKKQANAKIFLWGRSMGANCCIMFASKYRNQIEGMILDQPFRNLSTVVERIAQTQTSLPSFLLQPALYFVKKKVVEQVNHDIFNIDYLEIFKKISPSQPILFIYSHFDKIVPSEQVFQFYNAYYGQKDLCEIFQTHDEDRPIKVYKEGISWIIRKKNTNKLKKTLSEFGRSSLQADSRRLSTRLQSSKLYIC